MNLLKTIGEAFIAFGRCLASPAQWPGALWRLGHVLWICRVAVVGVAAGGILLAYTVQARDLFADLGVASWQWAMFFALLFFWAWVVHADARQSLQHDDWASQCHELPDDPRSLQDSRRLTLQELYWYPAVWFPRLFSLAVFVFIGVAIGRTFSNLYQAANGVPEAAQALTLAKYLFAATVVVALIYIALIWKPRTFGDWIAPNDPAKWTHEPPLLAGTAPLLAALFGYRRPTPAPPRELVDRARSIARIVVIVLLMITVIDPHFFAASWPRLFFIPVLFGGAVVLLGEVAAWSMRWRTPLLLGIAMLALVCVYLTESFHDTRWIEARVEPSPAAGDKRQVTLLEAVDRWKAANNCAAAEAICPRPILIAGAGGASRAGFYTATIVGALIDLGHDKERGALYGDVRSRIFALSTVSGSSVGAVVMRAALLDAAASKNPDKPPCKNAGDGSWFGLPLMASNKAFDPSKNWRDCFQAILTGDFLSPVFVALAFRDNFPFLYPITWRPAWSDRAVLLEQAFERSYRRFTNDRMEVASCQSDVRNGGSEGLCRPFGYHPDPKIVGAWVPIFFINGTSVFTGRRIVVGDVATSGTYGSGTPLMPLAYDLYEARARKKDDKKKALYTAADIRLSTAATMSARFPVISPHGVLRTLYGDVTDQIVDGGYFENDGLATALDLAEALKNGFKLNPVVIRIINEPAKPEDPTADKTRPPTPTPGERGLFDDFFAVARALVASRSGHEEAYSTLLESRLGKPSYLYDIGVYEFTPGERNASASGQQASMRTNPFCRREVKGTAKMQYVSMSWWMSQPVQAYLDAQLCNPANWERLECELREGRTSQGRECRPNL